MFDQINRKTLFGIIIILAIVILAGYFILSNRTGTEPVEVTQSATATPTISPTATLPTSPVSPISTSPVSPVSPVEKSPVSPLSLGEMVAKVDEAEAAYQAGDYDKTLAITEELLADDPFNHFAYNTRGNTYTALNRYDEALSDYSQAIEIDPFRPEPFYNRGRLYIILEKYDDAITDLQKSAELKPNDFGYRAYGNIGLIYHKMGEYEQALQAFETSMSYDDSKADVHYLRGETYTALENYEAAISDYLAAIDRFSQYGLAYESLGYAYYKTGQFDQARGALDQAIEISPGSVTAHFYLVLVSLAMDDLEMAETAATEGVSLMKGLSTEDQSIVREKILPELESLDQEDPDKSEIINSLIESISEAQ